MSFSLLLALLHIVILLKVSARHLLFNHNPFLINVINENFFYKQPIQITCFFGVAVAPFLI